MLDFGKGGNDAGIAARMDDLSCLIGKSLLIGGRSKERD